MGLLRPRSPSWPSCVASPDLHCFAQAVGEVAAACMPGDAGFGLQYLTRRLLGLLEIQHGPKVWDSLSFAELQEFASDANQHCRALVGLGM